MNINIPATGAVWDALPKEVRGAWYALSGLEMPALVESIDVMLSANFDHFDDSEKLVLGCSLDAITKMAGALYACGVLVIKSEPHNADGENQSNEGANDEAAKVVDLFSGRNRVQ